MGKITLGFLTLVLCGSFLQSDDIQRIEKVVGEITQLRLNYNDVQNQLTECQNRLQHQHLTKKQKSIENLENEIIYLKKMLKSKDSEILSLKNNMKINNSKNKINKTIYLENKTNTFPKLQKRDSANKSSKIKVLHTKPTTYRLKHESVIYDNVYGHRLTTWEKDTSFTSNRVSDNGWIKITGYFVDKKWRKASKAMWVHAQDAFKRD